MRKLSKYLWVTALIISLFCLGCLAADKQVLRNDLIRLHVVANSNSDDDQRLKLAVRDAVTNSFSADLQHMRSAQMAKDYLKCNLSEIKITAEEALQSLGCEDTVTVSLTQEAFNRRNYDTFSLPSGVYESLRIEIGEAEGKNWWCVVFPGLCAPVTKDAFVSTAVTGGIEQDLASTLSHEEGYEVRFFLLDLIGKIENFFHFR